MKKIFVFLLLGVFFLSLSSAWTEDAFNNSLTEENLTFTGDENITRWLSVPEDTILANAYMNLSGHEKYAWNITGESFDLSDRDSRIEGIFFNGTYWFAAGRDTTTIYQHYTNWTYTSISYNLSSEVGILTDLYWNGTYWFVSDLNGDILQYYQNWTYTGVSYPTGLFPDSFTFNGTHWSVEGFSDFKIRVYYQNWTYTGFDLPTGSSSIGWDGTNYWTSDLFSGVFQYYTNWTATGYNVSSIGDSNDIYFYNAFWYRVPLNGDIVYKYYGDMDLSDPYIGIGNNKVWNYTSSFNSTVSPNETSNFAQTINNYISTATAAAGFYLIPFIFHSDTAGILEYLNLIFNNNGVIENSQTYPSASVESATETYTANITYDNNNFDVITGKLNLDGNEYTGTKSGTGDTVVFSTDATMPSVTTQTNYTAYWTFSLTDESGTNDYNITPHNVTVSAINLTLCDGSNNVPFWNFTVLNETNLVEINSTLEVTFAVRVDGSSTDNYFSFADVTGTNSQFDFCMSPATDTYDVDAAIKLTKSGFVDKFYNYESVALTNTTREDNLFMMTTGDSTSFIIHTVYTNAQDIASAEVQVQRYYPGTNEWLTTEILTTNDVGTAVGHILSEDADYRFLVYLDGVSIHNSSATKIVCAVTPCTVTLVVPIITGTGYELLEEVTSTLVFSNNIFTYTYSDSSGSFTQARLYVIRLAPSNSTIVMPCNDTKTDSSGVLTCDISGQINGTYQATGYITRDGDELFDKRVNANLGTKIYDSFGIDGVLWSIFIFIGIVMVGIKRPSSAIIFGTVGFIVLALMNIINIGAISIVSIIAIGIILLWLVGKE